MSGFAAFLGNLVGSVAPSLIPLFSHGFKGVKGAFQSMSDATTGAHLTGSQKEANAFNAEQAQKQMDFQQQMRDTQYQSAVNDMRASGINPALMYGSGASGNVAPSGAMASSVAPSEPDVIGLLGQIQNLRLLGAQARKLKTEADLNEQEISESRERVGQIRANVGYIMANTNVANANARKLNIENNWLDVEHALGVQIQGLTASEISARTAELNQKVKNLSAEEQKTLQELTNLQQEYNNLIAQENLTNEQAENCRNMNKQINAMAANLIANTNLTNMDIAEYGFNHAKNVKWNDGYIDSKGNMTTFGSSKGVQSVKKGIKNKWNTFKTAVKAANDLR